MLRLVIREAIAAMDSKESAWSCQSRKLRGFPAFRFFLSCTPLDGCLRGHVQMGPHFLVEFCFACFPAPKPRPHSVTSAGACSFLVTFLAFLLTPMKIAAYRVEN